MQFPNFKASNNSRQVDMALRSIIQEEKTEGKTDWNTATKGKILLPHPTTFNLKINKSISLFTTCCKFKDFYSRLILLNIDRKDPFVMPHKLREEHNRIYTSSLK